jgi:hypothetical protein
VASHNPASQRLADAVAVAGFRAAATQCPRLVLLLASESPDASQFSPAEVIEFPDTIHVPLVVLRWGDELEVDRCGGIVLMGDRRNLRPAMVQVRRALTRQWIAWIDGTHPLHQIELRADAKVGSSFD